jgi:hypothetical protein
MQSTDKNTGLPKGSNSLPKGKNGLHTSKLWQLQPKWIKSIVNETESNPYDEMTEEEKAQLEADCGYAAT